MGFTSFLLNKIQSAFSAIIPSESIASSKQKWNALGKENARYYVLSTHGKSVSEEQFIEDGLRDYQLHISSDNLLSERLGDFSTKTVLEIGCGIGRITSCFSDYFKHVFGLDIAESMIEQARSRLADKKNVTLVATDGLTYPVPDASVDFVFSFIVFQHMPDAAIVESNFKEISRVLKSGGVAKIQLRGIPLRVSKKEWYYGVSYSHDDVVGLLERVPVKLVREEGVGEKYYWITFTKN